MALGVDYSSSASARAAPDRLKALEPLEAVLAAHAGGDLRHGPEPSGRDTLLALLADSVLAAAQPLEGLGQLVRALDQHAPRGEAHLAVLVDLDQVDLIGEGRVVTERPRELLQDHRAAHLTDAVHRM
jgi:hypothetical protein